MLQPTFKPVLLLHRHRTMSHTENQLFERIEFHFHSWIILERDGSVQYKYSCTPENETPVLIRTSFSTFFPLGAGAGEPDEWTISGCCCSWTSRLLSPYVCSFIFHTVGGLNLMDFHSSTQLCHHAANALLSCWRVRPAPHSSTEAARNTCQ